MMPAETKAALILSGGGARAAYHAGVLKAVRELLPDPHQSPFPILCGTSAGAFNAAILASHGTDFAAGVDALLRFWTRIHAADVYRVDVMGMVTSGFSWLALPAGGGPRSVLDTAPLRRLLATSVDLTGIDHAISERALHALSITCSGYGSGQSVTFFQGRPDLEPWRLGQRVGAHVKLELDHLLASAAIPFLFPAVRLHREWFGDGAFRQTAPLSPALHLGAQRVLAIEPGPMAVRDASREAVTEYPSLAQVAGHVLSGAYADGFVADLERMAGINRTLALVPADVRPEGERGLRTIDLLTIAPSKRLDHLAAGHMQALPWTVRRLLAAIGGEGREGGAFASCLLFEPAYTNALIEVGYADTMASRDDVARHLAQA